MQKHLGRVVQFGWLPTIAFAAVAVSDMSAAVINADKNIATLLKNLGWQQPPQQIATYIWEHPWAAIIVVALIFAVGVGISWGLEKLWIWLWKKRTPDSTPVPESDDIATHLLSVSPPDESALIKGNKEAQHAETFQSAFDDALSNKVPFIRIRHDAHQFGLILDDSVPTAQNLAYDIEGAMRQAAVDGNLKVWGRKYHGLIKDNDPLVPIPSSHFEEYGFAHGCLHYAMPNEKTATGTIQMLGRGEKGKEGVTYYDLFISYDDARRVLTQIAKDQSA